jgi:hypothetical protein
VTGQCKYCRKRNVQISQFDRFPDNVLIRNKYGDAQGVCYDCELMIPSTKKELLEAHTYLKESVHMYIATRELLSLLPDKEEFNLKTIYKTVGANQGTALSKEGYVTGHPTPNQQFTISRIGEDEWEKRIYGNLKEHVGFVVVAAARMGQENTPKERKQAARSIFLRGLIRYGMASGNQEKLKKEYGKWFNKIF